MKDDKMQKPKCENKNLNFVNVFSALSVYLNISRTVENRIYE
jgi:hypothetical protein